MNKSQLIVLWVGIAFVVLMGIFPPWVVPVNPRNTRLRRDVGYKLLFCQPSIENKGITLGGFIDFRRLTMQWAMIAIITGVLIIIFKDKQPKDEQEQ